MTGIDHNNIEKPKMGSERSFGIVFFAVFATLASVSFYKSGLEWAWPLAILSAVFLLLAISAPSVLKPLNIAWFRFGLLLHKIISPIILSVLFFLTVTPTAIIMRFLGKDLLRLRLEPDAESYWIHRDPPGPHPQSMTDQF